MSKNHTITSATNKATTQAKGLKRSLVASALTMVIGVTTATLYTPSFAADESQKAAKEKTEDKEWDVLNPPGEHKSITIDTKQTTWSNLDVSPDGKTIVFDMLGDIYTMPIKGGKAKALTSDMAWNTEPVYSPDGKTIAFISDRKVGDNIWLMDVDGTNLRQVTKESRHILHNPEWSPDGNYLVGKQGHMSSRSIAAGSIWMYHKSGGKGIEVRERLHGKKSQKNVAEPIYSPDGKYLYYSVDATSGHVWAYNKNALSSIFEIRRKELATGIEETVIRGSGGAIRPKPSNDGKHLAYVKRVDDVSALYVKNLKSGIETEVYKGLDRDLQETSGEHGNTANFAWTPDDQRLVFWAKGTFHSVGVKEKDVKNIPVHVQAEKQVTKALRYAVDVAPDTFKVKMARWTQLSPDGKKALFQAVGYIYVRDIKSGKVKRLTKQKDHFEYYPSFSADGKSVVYTTWDDNKLGSVRVAKLRNGRSKIITEDPGHYVSPTFSKDGKKVLFRKVTGGYLLSGDWSMEPGIYVASAKGGDVKRVVKSGSNPQFSPDGKRVLFNVSGGATELQLKSTNFNGKDERTHLKGEYISDFKVSPDGKWVAFIQHYNVYVAPFVSVGKALTIDASTKGYPVKKVSGSSGDYLNWRADSSGITWAFGSTLYKRDLKDAFAFLNGAPDELPEAVTEGIDVGFDVKTDKPSGMIALVGGKVVTMRNADNEQEVIENGVVLIENNRIKAVGKQGEVDIPRKAETIDVSGKTIIPGLVDVHAHASYASYDMQPQQSWNQYSYLSFGVTTLHDPSNNSSEVFSMAELTQAGRTVAPRIYSVGRIMYAGNATGYKTKIADLEEAKFHVKRLKDAGAISVKSYNHPARETRQQVLEAARAMEIMVVPEGGAKFQHNMNMIVDGHTGLEHAVPIRDIYSDVVQMWSQTDVGYTPTFVVAYGGLSGENYFYQHHDVWKNERLMSFVPKYVVEPRSTHRNKAPESHYNHKGVAKGAKTLRDAGVRVHIGAHGQREGLAAHWELWSMEHGGFTPWEAIRGGTIDGAKYLAMDKDIGSIETGKLADLAIIDGDVLSDLSLSEKVAYTVINGRIYDAATMNEIGNHKNKREQFFFERANVTNMHPDTATYMEEKAHQYHWKH